MGQKDVQVAYFGQNYWSDVNGAWEYDFNQRDKDSKSGILWDPIAIVHDQEYVYEQVPRELASETTSKFTVRDKQGPAYFFTEEADTVNMFLLHAAHKARYILPAASAEYLK